MKEIEIVIDRNGLEKKIIISSGLISFDNSDDSINSKYDVSPMVIFPRLLKKVVKFFVR